MTRRIIYIVKSDLNYYPPCLSQIRMIHDLGVPIEVWFGSSKETAKQILASDGIPFRELVDPRGRLPEKLDVAVNWLSFRRALEKQLANEPRGKLLLWFGTAESVMPMVGALKGYEYVVSALELYDDDPVKRALLGSACKGAVATTACEISRAYIMRQWWSLGRLPYVFPNKPYGMELRRELPLTCDETKRIVDEVGDEDFVIYQGILQNEDSVKEIAQALKALECGYPLVMMGIDRNGMAPRIKETYSKTLYYPSIPAPRHLEVTSRAHIGVVFYDGANLNKAFCAPNKIYEYSSFGMPMLANCVPGLVNTVGAFGCAECVDLNASDIAAAIARIDSDYSTYSANAARFFEHTDNVSTMRTMLTGLEVLS